MNPMVSFVHGLEPGRYRAGPISIPNVHTDLEN